MEPLDPELQEAYTLTDIGGRVAVLCGLHQLAVTAGLVQPDTTSSSSRSSGSSSCSSSESYVLEVEAAGVGLWNNWLQVWVAVWHFILLIMCGCAALLQLPCCYQHPLSNKYKKNQKALLSNHATDQDS